MSTKTTVIYHSADFDGIFCREIARHFLGDKEVEYIGWNFGDPAIPFPDEGMVYVMDLPPDAPFGLKSVTHEIAARMVWLDHHRTSLEKYMNETVFIPSYRIDGVAACRLAWQWFSIHKHPPHGRCLIVGLPTKQGFLDRKVSEPLAVRLAGEYDVWDHRGDGDIEFQFGLRSVELHDVVWRRLLSLEIRGPQHDYASELVRIGKISKFYSENIDADLATHKSFRLKWEGLDFLCLNTGRFNSLTFAAMDKPETGHDALLGFCWTGKVWTVSLYHAAHRKDLDLSKIAVKHGGGGHKGACGFTCKTLPFPL